ncbi:hypothetical protein BDV59DRAFT_204659 [Aspergillus ambiguus]|uniref:uncharacterized protein n=1 Tax=Aspergillus ambiguus TaxID=176160 RepID=UPI003CCDFD9A
MLQFPLSANFELERAIGELPESLALQLLAARATSQDAHPDPGVFDLPDMNTAPQLPEASMALYMAEPGLPGASATSESYETSTVATLGVGVAESPLAEAKNKRHSFENKTIRLTSKKRKRPSGRTVPRQDSPNAIHPLNHTTFREDQQHWSWENMPDILYQLHPDEKRDRKAEAPMMKHPIHGKLLRDLPVLPDNIASTVEEFRVEAWMRMDRRVRLQDITDRMHPMFRVNGNALQQRSVRFRQIFGLLAWDSGNKRSRVLENNLLKKMRENGIDPASNSTRGITPGLIHPALGEAGGRIPLPKSGSQAKQGVNKWNTKKPKLTDSPLRITHSAEAEEYTQSAPVPKQQTRVNEQPGTGPCMPSQKANADERDLVQVVILSNVRKVRRDEAECVANPTPLGTYKARPSLINLQQHMCYKGCQTCNIPTPRSGVPGLKFNLTKALAYDIRSPSSGVYDWPPSPFPDTVFPEQIRSTMFRSMVEQCFNGQKYLFELPYLPGVMNTNDQSAI